MLHRKINQICNDEKEVCIFLRDQQRWIESAKITAFEGEILTIRYETEEDDEVSSWEELVRLESVGAITQKLASVPKMDVEIAISEDCPEAEQIFPHFPDSKNQD
ncbi:DUF6679 family protein [[Limnothrix rosea] IAM M-220]|uniref:DUF6679 family protein n=1 Tax=[Limnothrix rosea] IAM M-220 TaxID=454133 RepID=UPI00096408A9|nr:DUF6679 family protein [[Limnothrix rosea] IAM M-220]OKH11614.1 hypothetical protein NIES208_17105 [[Limnothrix rosea] IAM M-220]